MEKEKVYTNVAFNSSSIRTIVDFAEKTFGESFCRFTLTIKHDDET
jgi:hypothetical protein